MHRLFDLEIPPVRIYPNLERWPYMWDSERDAEIKNRFLDPVGEGEGGMIWENSAETCILPYVK